jgi:hypothetical protein
VSQTYAVISVSGFFIIAIGILRLAAPWDVILRESGRLDEDDVPAGEEEGQDQHNHLDHQPQHDQEQVSDEIRVELADYVLP